MFLSAQNLCVACIIIELGDFVGAMSSHVRVLGMCMCMHGGLHGNEATKNMDMLCALVCMASCSHGNYQF